MQIDTSIDDIFWMKPPRNFASGTEIAGFFAKGMQMAEDKRRFEMMVPLKMKEAEANIARDVAQTAKSAWELDYTKKEALAEAAQMPAWMTFSEQLAGALVDPNKPLPTIPKDLTGERLYKATAMLQDGALKKSAIQAKTATAMAQTIVEKENADLIAKGYLMAGQESNPQSRRAALAMNAHDEWRSMVAAAGAPPIAAQVPPINRNTGKLDMAAAQTILKRYAPKPPAGMVVDSVTVDAAGNMKGQTLKQPDTEKPTTEKLKTEDEWVQANTVRFSKMKNEDDELLYKTPEQAVAAARAEYRAMSGKQPEKPASDTAAQAERLAKSQNIPFVRSPEERNKLPKGTRYVMPNGQVAIKQ